MTSMLILKVTLVLLAGGGIALLLRRQPAALRHYVWVLTLAGAVVVAIPASLPWRVDVPVAAWSVPATVPAPIHDAFDTPSPNVSSTVDAPVSSPSVPTDRTPTGPAWPRPSFALVWMLGAFLVVVWHLLGHWGLSHLVRTASPVRDARWLRTVERHRKALGIGTPVDLRHSATIGSPLVYGIVRPVILLPDDAHEWSDERRDVVVLHELAHVSRRDGLSQLLASAACAVWWFHPGAWLAARRLRSESERACDDRVMDAGIPALDYASHLLGVARNARALRMAGAVAITMARKSTLEGRLLAMLDPRRHGGVLTRSWRAFGAVALVTLLVTLSVVRPVARPSAAADSIVETSPATQTAEAPTPPPTPSRSEPSAVVPVTPEPDLLAANDTKKDKYVDAEEGSPFRDVVDAKPGGTLVLELETGGTVTVRGWTQNRVQVDGVLAGEDWDRTETDLHREGDRVVFRSEPEPHTDTHNFSTSHRFDIRVPQRFDVKIRSAGGKITLIGLEGDMTGSSGGGGITMERLKGHARLSTGGGPIDVDNVDMSGSVSTGGGLVKLSRVTGGLRGTSGSGPVIQADPESDPDGDPGDLDGVEIDASNISLAGRTRSGRLSINKAGGDIRIDQAPDGIKATTGGGKVAIGPSAKRVELSTGGGPIEIGPAKGSVSAGSGAGDIHLVLAKSSERDRHVRLWTGKGTIVIELEKGVGVDLDLETAYTDGFGRKTSIRSDVPVDIEASDDWDMSHGSPRKYIRARATHGDGSVKMQVRTVNGDIVLKYK